MLQIIKTQMKNNFLVSAALLLLVAVPGALSADEPRLRGVAVSTENSLEDQLELEVFDTSEDFDSIDVDRYDEDYSFYESEDEEEDSFATAARRGRPLAKQCFRWHDSAACRGGGRAGHCRSENWTEKCIYCKRGEKADRKTGKCVRSGSDGKVKQCFRWHDSAACRGGGRAGHCRSENWTEKCIYCKRGEKAGRKTGKCVRSGSDGKVKQCFRWHDSAACREGGRAGHCRSENWTEKCIYCKRGKEADRKTGKCVRSGSDGKVKQCFRWHDSAACRGGGRAGHCRSENWTEKCIMCSQDKKVNKVTGKCERNEMFMKEA